MGSLSTHVLDTAIGKPAAGMHIELFQIDGSQRFKLGAFKTNNDGRVDQPLLSSDLFKFGIYELIFYVGDYLTNTNNDTPSSIFLDQIPIRFIISEDNHYHIPLLLSPYGYSTYRGS